MKKMIAMAALAAAVFTAGAEMARSEWQGKVGACAQNPALLQQTIGQLSAADQLAFLGQVNQAISAMPGSKDQKAAAFYAANKAAVVGATRENRTAVLAEVYATVPVEVLTVINERFAAELLNRKNSPSVTDQQYFGISTNVMMAVNERVSKDVENAGARAAFAAMMLVRASGGSPEGLANALADTIADPNARQEAKSTWLPAALNGDNPSYDQILGATQSPEEPNKGNVNNLAPSTGGDGSVLNDLGKSDGKNDSNTTNNGGNAPANTTGGDGAPANNNGGNAPANTTGGDAAPTTVGGGNTPTTGGGNTPTTGGDAAPTTTGGGNTPTTGGEGAPAGGGDNFHGGIFMPNAGTVPGSLNPASSGDAVSTTDPSGVSGAGSTGGGVSVPVPRDSILSPTIVDPKTGETVPNPYYNEKRGDGPNTAQPTEPEEDEPTPPHPDPYRNQGL